MNGVLDESGRVEKWNWCASYDRFEIQKQKFERVKESRTWYHWNQLAIAHEMFINYEKWQEELLNKKMIMKAMDNAMAFQELDNLLKGGKVERPLMFIRDLYERYLRGVHSFFIQILSEMEDMNSEVPGDVCESEQYWPDDAHMVGNKFIFDIETTISFSLGSHRFKIFRKLFEAKGGGLTISEINSPEICNKDDIRRILNGIQSDRIVGNKDCRKIRVVSDKNWRGARYCIQYNTLAQ